MPETINNSFFHCFFYRIFDVYDEEYEKFMAYRDGSMECAAFTGHHPKVGRGRGFEPLPKNRSKSCSQKKPYILWLFSMPVIEVCQF